MRFEYETKQDDRECVAVVREIDGKINLTIKTDEGCTYIYDDHETPNHGTPRDWDHEVSLATHKFYPGDKITITF